MDGIGSHKRVARMQAQKPFANSASLGKQPLICGSSKVNKFKKLTFKKFHNICIYLTNLPRVEVDTQILIYLITNASVFCLHAYLLFLLGSLNESPGPWRLCGFTANHTVGQHVILAYALMHSRRPERHSHCSTKLPSYKSQFMAQNSCETSSKGHQQPSRASISGLEYFLLSSTILYCHTYSLIRTHFWTNRSERKTPQFCSTNIVLEYGN